MFNKVKEALPKKFKNYKINLIKGGASKRKYYRLKEDQQNIILMDSSEEPEQFYNF